MARELSTSTDITEQELVRRKDFLEFREEDVGNLASINDLAQQYADSVIDEFYKHLLSFDETRTFFQDPEVLQRVKNSQQEYFLRLTQGNYNLVNRFALQAVFERGICAICLACARRSLSQLAALALLWPGEWRMRR